MFKALFSEDRIKLVDDINKTTEVIFFRYIVSVKINHDKKQVFIRMGDTLCSKDVSEYYEDFFSFYG